MRILVVGGSGDVGTIVVPLLAQHHQIRVFDMRPPSYSGCEYVPGNVNNPADFTPAVEGMDALLYMAMGRKVFNTDEGITTQFDVNIKGVYLALRAAHLAGIKHAVYTSTLSVYQDLGTRYVTGEDMPPDAREVYGLTKRLGEEICRNAVEDWGMSINALRLCFPLADERWYEVFEEGTPNCATTASDLAQAVLATLEYRNGFQAFIISGDYKQEMVNMTKAKEILNWEPLARPTK